MTERRRRFRLKGFINDTWITWSFDRDPSIIYGEMNPYNTFRFDKRHQWQIIDSYREKN